MVVANSNQGSTLKIWWKALRFHFVAGSVLPALLGSIIALQLTSSFNIFYFLLVIIALACNNAALNMSDDYFDYKHGVDMIKTGEKNEYTGGSGVLTNNEISTDAMRKGFFVFYGITILIGLYLTFKVGWLVFALGVFGVFSAYYYTAPPIKFAYYGFGETVMLINYGPIIVIGAYYVQTQSIPTEIVLMSLPSGFLMFCKILANELPDYKEDLKANKRTLVVRFGKKNGFKILITFLFVTYLIVIVTALLGYASKFILISLLTMPVAYRGVKDLKNTLEQENVTGNLDIIKTSDYTVILLVLAYCCQILIYGENIIEVLVLLLTLCAFYMPVFLKFRQS